jgi:hypothetical protein
MFVGQWAPIVGTGLAVLGSLYLLLAAGGADVDTEIEKQGTNPSPSEHHCNCSMQEARTGIETPSSHSIARPDATDIHRSSSNGGEGTSNRIVPTTSRSTTDAGNRRKVAKTLAAIGTYLGTAAPDRFDDSDFKHGKALDFPEIPGEEQRNPDLPQIREQYNPYRDVDGNVTPVFPLPSRAGSFIGSVGSRVSMDDNSTPGAASPQSPHSPHERTSFELPNPPSSSFSSSGIMPRQRRDTLEVPSSARPHHSRNNLSVSSTTAIPKDQSSPAIAVSSDPDTSSPAHPSVSNPALPSTPQPRATPPTATSPPPS